MSCLTSDDYLKILQDLLPVGPAFPRDANTVQTAFLRALADAQTTSTARQCNLLIDAFPSTSVELIQEWMASVGLPDPCWDGTQTLDQEQKAVVARLTADGGQSIPYFQQFATALGFPNTTFTEYSAYHVGMPVGLPIYGSAWNYALRIDNPSLAIYYFQTGVDTAGTPLSWTASSPLVCELRRIMPGHIYLIFNYHIVYRNRP